jgi:signal transduction histidine kinase
MHHRVKQEERLRTAATMATQFAHEVRNPVAAISGSAQVLGKLQRQVVAQGSPLYGVTDSDRALLYECIVNESDRLDGIIAKFLSVNEFSDQRMEGADPGYARAHVANYRTARNIAARSHLPNPSPSGLNVAANRLTRIRQLRPNSGCFLFFRI